MRRIVTLIFALLLIPLVALHAVDSKPAKSNFVVILIDDMGYGDIGPFESKLNRTPNFDRIAKEGMKLTSFYCAPLCSASRAQLMTGCYAKRVGIADVLFPVKGAGLSANEKTIADHLKPLGYATMCIGKWHLGDQPDFLPTRHGFDHFFGLPYSNNMDGTGKKPDAKNPMPPLPLLRDEKVIEAPPVQNQLTERFTEESVKFITGSKDKPFFLYLPHIAVHSPLEPGKAFQGKSNNGDYGDWVEEVDASVGCVLDTLKELKLDQNTLVLFTSDSGGTGKRYSNAPLRGKKGSTWEGGQREPTIAWWPGQIAAGAVSDVVMSEIDVLPTLVGLAGGKVPAEPKIDGADQTGRNAPFRSGKGSVYEGGIHVPCLLRWPRELAAGSVSQQPICAQDLYPTLAAAAGVTMNDNSDAKLDGKNLWPAIRSGVVQDRGPFLISTTSSALFDGDWKLIETADGRTSLFQLASDPGETTDLIVEQPAVAQRLRAKLVEFQKDFPAVRTRARPGRPAR